ncbi:MAG: hypothetical protein HRU81_02985 [Gammaproteobacteria bacterium]|nr:MAG: hypothetical protein HRU81_02985 [Gammaproteobacteria bacterium]
MSTTAPTDSQGTFRRLFYRPPFVGMLAFFVVFIMQGLGHTQMVLMEKVFHAGVYTSAFILGLIGAACLWIAMRSESEVTATWLGFFAGTCLWTGWVEFTYVWSAKVLLNVPDLMDKYSPGEIATKGEYLVMMSSAGVLLATLMPLLMNRETKCNMFQWFQRRLGLRTGRPSHGYERNFGYITALETLYILWFLYLVLLFIYDDNILGDRHPVTYGIFFAGGVWSLYLLNRLRQMWKVTTAIRYAIPTALIAYSTYEIAGRWHLYTDIWVEPGRYWLELSLFLGAMVVGAAVAVLTPAHHKAKLDRQGQLKRG